MLQSASFMRFMGEKLLSPIPTWLCITLSDAPETMRAVEEIGLIDGEERFSRCALDDFVFERRNAERPLPPIEAGP